jgi:hypothetical protein
VFFFSAGTADAKLSSYQMTVGGASNYNMSSATTIWQGYQGSRIYNTYGGTPYDFSSGVISIPFTFNFNGVNYTQLQVYMSGIITLGSSTLSSSFSNSLGAPSMPVIAAFWDDLHLTGDGGGCWNPRVSWMVTGSAPNRVFVAEWQDFEINYGTYYSSQYGWGNRGTFQAQLFENGQIAFYYTKMEWKSSCGGWQGYENYGMKNGVSGSIGLSINGEMASVTPGATSTVNYTTANNSINLETQVIAPKTSYVFTKLPNVQLSTTPKIIDYGTVSAGAFATANVVVKHAGTEGVLNISAATITGLGASQFSVISTPGPLTPGQQANLVVRFTPTVNGQQLATLTVSTNGVDSGTQQILLSGLAVAPTIQIIPINDTNTATRMFKKTRTMVGDSLRQSFLVKNVGAGTLVISPSSGMTGDFPTNYKITRWPLYSLGAGLTDTMSITFAPTFEGAAPARANIVNNATNGTQSIDLFGLGIIPRIELTPGEMLTFDSVAMGATVCKNIRITNIGSDTLRLSNNYLSSSDGDFSYTPLTGVNTKIAPNSFRDVQVCITPLQKGTRRARLRFTTNIPLTFPTSGPRQDTNTESLEIWANAVPSDKTIIAMGDFSDAVIGTESSIVVTMTNAGSELITVEAPIFSGVNASTFKATKANFPINVAPETSISFTVVGTPSLRGANTAVMNIANKSEDRQYLQAVNLTVKGLMASSSVNETSLSFDKLYLGEESSKTITVANTGDVDQVYTATLVGAGFTLTSDAMSDAVAPGSSAVYTVKFAPSLKGAASGTLTLTSTHIADMSVALSGNADEKPVSQSVKGDVAMKGFVLSQNAPNPATGKTAFTFTTPSSSEVRITLADITGKTVRELANGVFGAGEHSVNIVTNDIPSGSYVYILESDGVRLVRQMIISK